MQSVYSTTPADWNSEIEDGEKILNKDEVTTCHSKMVNQKFYNILVKLDTDALTDDLI